MFLEIRVKKFFLLITLTLFSYSVVAEDEEIYLQAISDQIQVITKDLKTLEKAVYQKSDVVLSNASNQILVLLSNLEKMKSLSLSLLESGESFKKFLFLLSNLEK